MVQHIHNMKFVTMEHEIMSLAGGYRCSTITLTLSCCDQITEYLYLCNTFGIVSCFQHAFEN